MGGPGPRAGSGGAHSAGPTPPPDSSAGPNGGPEHKDSVWDAQAVIVKSGMLQWMCRGPPLQRIFMERCITQYNDFEIKNRYAMMCYDVL